jgi:hypothetical protein
MELGDPAEQRTERGRLDVVLDKLNDDFAELLETVETGGLDQLTADQKVAVWRRFETFRNRLPLIDHTLIVDAEATDLPGTHCSSSLARFWWCCNSPPGRQPPESGPQQRLWILGGLTDLDNLTLLLCRYHHTHFLQQGWTSQPNADGLPEWIPHPGGSTNNNDRKSTPASDASTPNINNFSAADGNDQPTLHEWP